MLVSLCLSFVIDRVKQFTSCVIHFLVRMSGVSLFESLAELNMYII